MDTDRTDKRSLEKRSLAVGKWANLLLAGAGIAAAYASRSDALLVDGLYSGMNFASAMVAARVSVAILRPADRRYPFGYSAYEALYAKFRGLFLLGIMTFAAFGAVRKIVTYATGGQVPALVFGPIMVYTVAMVTICFGLATWHRYNWRRSGRRSVLLSTESKAAVVDGLISGGAGGGLVAASLLQDTSLGFLVPVADAIVVLVLTACMIRQPLAMFLGALREVAGAAADPETHRKVRLRMEKLLKDRAFSLLEVVVTKMGRCHFVVAYVKPDVPVSGDAADALWKEIEASCVAQLQDAKAELIIAATGPFSQ